MSFRGKNALVGMQVWKCLIFGRRHIGLFISRCQSIDNDFACQASRAPAPLPGRLFYCKHVHFNMQRFDEK